MSGSGHGWGGDVEEGQGTVGEATFDGLDRGMTRADIAQSGQRCGGWAR
jgi:hypothetical protein